MYVSGPGHGAPATLANSYLEGYYSEIYPDKNRDEQGMLKFFRKFHSRAALEPTAHRRPLDLSMKAGSLATLFRTPMELHSTILLSLSLSPWATEKRRPDLQRRHRTPDACLCLLSSAVAAYKGTAFTDSPTNL